MRFLVSSAIAALVLPLFLLVAPSTVSASPCPGVARAAGSAATSGSCDSSFIPLAATRLYDSRDHNRLRAGKRLDVAVTGHAGVPRDAVAVALNIHAKHPTENTNVSVWPKGTKNPHTTTLKLRANHGGAAMTIAGIGTDGAISIATAHGKTEVLVDVLGYYVRSAARGRLYHPAKPAFRLFDSRVGNGGVLANGESRTLKMPTIGGVTAKKMRAALVNVTAVGASGPGHLSVYRAGSARPSVFTLTYGKTYPTSNRTVTQLRGGKLTVTNIGRATDVVVTVEGWFASRKVAGGQLYSPLRPFRVLDTRSGRGAPAGFVKSNAAISLGLAGAGRALPKAATVAVMTLTATHASSSTYLKAWPTGGKVPAVADVFARPGHRSANLAAVKLASTGAFTVFNRFGTTHVLADVVGYYRPAKKSAVSQPGRPGSGSGVMFGMSAPALEWGKRVAEVGPGLRARRIFLTSFSASLNQVKSAQADGLYPVVSFKTGGYSWADVAAGRADADLKAMAAKLDALSGPVFVAVHHEPEKDGTPQAWSAMQVHALPILGRGNDVFVGVIGNGWWWSAKAKGYSDAQIAQWITPGVRKVSDVIAGDTYDGGGEDAGVKIRRMSAWAGRVGVSRLGVGEFNGQSAAAITHATDAAKADPRFVWACVWNSNTGPVTVLTGARLAAFRAALR
jgi:hypothetical protein